MADYDTTVGVQLYDDFSALEQALPKIIAQLKTLKSMLQGINGMKIDTRSIRATVTQLEKLSNIKNLDSMFSNLNKTLGNINFSNIKSLREELSKMKDEYRQYLSMINRQTGNSLKSSNKLERVKYSQNDSSGLNDLNGTKNKTITSYIQNMNSGLSSIDDHVKKTKKNISDMFSVGKMYFFFNYSKQIFRGIGNIIQQSLNFTETENYFSRAMGNMYDQAMTFQNKLEDMYGMSMNTMMNAQATYKNMIGSLGGLSDEMSYKLSETVTKMTLDFSSLYNVDFDKTVQKMQSALSKQVRPIRSVSGFDITQNVLESTAMSIGIDRSISQMNELEKRLLIILTLANQMRNSGAMNDFARTIEQPSNQLRILKEQLQEVGRWLGSVFYSTIGAILPYINGFVMAIKEVIKTFALFVGYEIPNSSGETGTILDSYGDSMNDFNASIGDTNKGLSSAKKKADELKGSLAGFDKLNVIQKPKASDTSGGGGSAGGGGLSVDPKILDALNKYKYLFDDIHMKAKDIRDELLKWADIAKNSFKENIFEPIQTSWNKYGKSILQNARNSFNDVSHIASGVFDIVGDKWKPFFQQASNLFFSLLDTASLVSSTVTSFFRNIWDSGGNRFLEGLFDLTTAFLELGTSINDNFIKPTLRAFKNVIGDNLGKIIGNVLGLMGDLMSAFSKFISWVSKSKSAMTLLITTFTSFYAVIKIGKLAQLWSSFKDGTSTVSKLVTIFAEHTKIGSKLWSSYVEGESKFNLLKTAWNKGLSVVSDLMMRLRDTVAQSKAYQLGMASAEASTTGMTLAQKLCAGATTLLHNALNFMSAHPLVAVVTAIGLAVGALALFNTTQDTTAERIKYCSQEIQDQYQEVLNLSNSIDSAIKNFDKQISSTEAQISVSQKYIYMLREMEDEDGYVKNISSAKTLIKEINEVLPNTVSITEDGKVQWQKTNKEIEESISLIKQQAQVQAYQETYTELLKTQIELKKKLNDQEKDLKDAQEKYNEAVKKENDFFEERHIHSKIYQEDVLEASKKLKEHETLVKGTTDEYNNACNELSTFDSALEDAIKSIGDTTQETVKLNAETEEAFSNIGKNGKEAFYDIVKALKENDRKMKETSTKTDEESKKQIQSYQNERNLKLQELAKMANDYRLTGEQIVNYASSNGVALTAQEKSTLKAIVDTYRTKGIEAGDEYISKLNAEIRNGSPQTTANAKTNIKEANNAIKGIPLTIKSIVENANNKALKVRKDAENYAGDITLDTKVSGAYKAGKNAGKDFKKGFSLTDIVASGFGALASFVGNIKFFATGGFPDVGQMFIAREKGPELVGTMGGRSVVANNQQIEAGIEEASYRGMMRAFKEIGGFNPNIMVHHQTVVDGKVVEESLDKANDEHTLKTGKPKFQK